jgi:FkbM family methyltransferase
MKIYIQIGANVGNDEFFRKVKELKSPAEIHLIEPNKNLHDELRQCYSSLSNYHNILIHDFGISNKSEISVLNLYSNSGLSSLIDRKSYNYKQSQIEIYCKTFNEFCKEFKISKIEYLTIDTEGLDYEILNSIDPSSIDIKEIVFEVWPYEEDDLMNRYRTGETFLNTEVLLKYDDYSFNKTIVDGMESIQLKKIYLC